jgi:hypothetical protein
MNNKDESVMVPLNKPDENDQDSTRRVKFVNLKDDNKEDAVMKEENKDKAKIAQAMAKSMNLPADDPQGDYNNGSR